MKNRNGASIFQGGRLFRISFFHTHAGAEIDLVLDREQTRIGYEFKCGASVAPGDWAYLKAGIADGVIHKGYVVYLGARAFPVSEKIAVVPAAEVLG